MDRVLGQREPCARPAAADRPRHRRPRVAGRAVLVSERQQSLLVAPARAAPRGAARPPGRVVRLLGPRRARRRNRRGARTAAERNQARPRGRVRGRAGPVAAATPLGAAAVVSLSAERSLDGYGDVLPAARRLRAPVLSVRQRRPARRPEHAGALPGDAGAGQAASRFPAGCTSPPSSLIRRCAPGSSPSCAAGAAESAADRVRRRRGALADHARPAREVDHGRGGARAARRRRRAAAAAADLRRHLGRASRDRRRRGGSRSSPRPRPPRRGSRPRRRRARARGRRSSRASRRRATGSAGAGFAQDERVRAGQERARDRLVASAQLGHAAEQRRRRSRATSAIGRVPRPRPSARAAGATGSSRQAVAARP